MNRWRRFLHRWAGTLPTRIIHAENSVGDRCHSPLFERGHVFSIRLPLVGEVNCLLHHYLRSDPDRGLHDHPWSWAVSLPLAGGYVEHRKTGIPMGRVTYAALRRRPGRFYRLTGYDFHAVRLAPGQTSWSLFFTGANDVKPWGFLRPLAGVEGLTAGVVYNGHSNPDGNHSPWWRTAPVGRLHKRAAP